MLAWWYDVIISKLSLMCIMLMASRLNKSVQVAGTSMIAQAVYMQMAPLFSQTAQREIHCCYIAWENPVYPILEVKAIE